MIHSIRIPGVSVQVAQKAQALHTWLATFSTRRKVAIVVVFAIGVGVAMQLQAALATILPCT